MYGSNASGGYGGGPSPNRYNYGPGPPNSYPCSSNSATGRVAPAPSKSKEVEDMINNLRVEELKKFLMIAGKDVRGKKNDLQIRALDMVGRGKTLSPQLLLSLKELHLRRSNERRGDLTSSDPWSSYSSSTAESVSGYRKSSGYSSTVTGNGASTSGLATAAAGLPTYHGSSATSDYRSMPGITSLFSQPSSMPDIPGRTAHIPSTVGKMKAPPYDPISYYNNIQTSKIPVPSPRSPVIPSVSDLKFTPLPFFEEISTVIAPTVLALKPDSRTGYHELTTMFTLSTPQANDISTSRKVTPGITSGMPNNSPKVDFGKQLLIRFAMATLGPTGNREVTEDCIPLNLNVKVNSKSVPIIIVPIDKKNPGVQFRMTRPIEITQMCKISPHNQNTIQLTWQHPSLPSAHGVVPANIDYSKTFCISTFMVHKLSSEDLLKKVKSKGTKPREFTASLIRDKLKDSDDEIATTSLRAQLMCPLGKMRITTPGRSTNCTHIQCFDILLFLQMNERKPTWSCPVCDKRIPFPTLVVDGLFTEILYSSRSEKCSEVAFLERAGSSQGSGTIEWDPIVKEEKMVKQEPKSESSKRSANAPIDLSPQSSSPQSKKSKKDEPEVIDLLSSDEDDGTIDTPMDLRRNSSESEDTIVDGTSGESEDDEYFNEVCRRSKNERNDRLLRSGIRGESSRGAPSTATRQPLPPSSPAESDDSDLVILD